MKKSILLILGSFFLISVAQAGAPMRAGVPDHFTGFYFGPSIGAVHVDFGNFAEMSVYDSGKHYSYGRSGKAVNSLDMVGSFFAGYAHVLQRNIFLGLEGQCSTTIGSRDIRSTNSSTYGTPSQRVNFEPEWQVVVRPGYLITPKLLAYVNLGVARASITSSMYGGVMYPYDTTFTKEEKDLLGFVAGIGAQYVMSEHLSFRLSFNATKYSSDSFTKKVPDPETGDFSGLTFKGEIAPVMFNSELSLVYTV